MNRRCMLWFFPEPNGEEDQTESLPNGTMEATDPSSDQYRSELTNRLLHSWSNLFQNVDLCHWQIKH